MGFIRNRILIHRIARYQKIHLTKARRQHCLGTALAAASLAKKFKLSRTKAFLAGLSHDLARELSVRKLLEMTAESGYRISNEEKRHPILLHGRAGCIILKDLGVKDKQVLLAVEHHIRGRKGMTPYEKILFVADFIEPNRQFLSQKFRQKLMQKDLDEMVYIVNKRIIKYYRRRKEKIAKNSKRLNHELKNRGKKT